jgi:hypothetical protein
MPINPGRSPNGSVHQWRAIRLALERLTATGRFKFYAPLVRQLPEVTIQWDASWIPAHAQAACRFEDDGSVTITFRSDASPRSLVVSAFHEFTHAADHVDVRNGTPTAWLEFRAYSTQRFLRDVLEADREL